MPPLFAAPVEACFLHESLAIACFSQSLHGSSSSSSSFKPLKLLASAFLLSRKFPVVRSQPSNSHFCHSPGYGLHSLPFQNRHLAPANPCLATSNNLNPCHTWCSRRQIHREAPIRQAKYICQEALSKDDDNGGQRADIPVDVFFTSPDDLSASDSETEEEASSDDDFAEDGNAEEYVVVNFYRFVEIEDPRQEVARHASFMQGRHIRGRIYISYQGINAQYSGPSNDAFAYSDWVKGDMRFSGLFVQVSPSPGGHAFPRLRLRYKPSLVQVEGGTMHLPLTEPSSRAVPLTPREWRKRLEATISSGDDVEELSNGTTAVNGDCSSKQRKILLLDVRNGYEWDVGHFRGAQRPEVDCCKSTDFGLNDRENSCSDPLAGVDRESTDVFMYCTGGIRCDVYSSMLRQKGFKSLYSLEGGVARYLIEEGPMNWLGNLFVFDSRLSVTPKYYQSMSLNEDISGGAKVMDVEENDAPLVAVQATFAVCSLCNSPLSRIRHRNCANLDCNQLHLSCNNCAEQLKGCCSQQCMSAPRLRPFLSTPQQYKRWYNYRSPEQPCTVPRGGMSRGSLNRQNRKDQQRHLQDSIKEI